MAEYIDREALEKELARVLDDSLDNVHFVSGFLAAVKVVKKYPTAELETEVRNLKHELEAAIMALKAHDSCDDCLFGGNGGGANCDLPGSECAWQWRGARRYDEGNSFPRKADR